MSQQAVATTTGVDMRLALEAIVLPANVRDLDPERIDALARSIKLRGLLVPIIVRPDDDGHELVAGHHRLAACRKLGHTDIAVTVREQAGATADTAAEHVARKAPNALEEARAVEAMLADGYTTDGAAEALGWPRQRVTARVKILELPDAGQQLVATGELPLSAIDTVLAIGEASQPLMVAVVDAIATAQITGADIIRQPSWAIGRALQGPDAPFAAYFRTVQSPGVLRLGEKTDKLLAEAEQLHRRVEQYSYGPPAITFAETDVDQARAAGVLIEFECRGAPIVTDKALYRELAKQAITRTVEQLRERAAREGSRETLKQAQGPAHARTRKPTAASPPTDDRLVKQTLAS